MIRPISRARDFQRLRAHGHTVRAGVVRIRVLDDPRAESHVAFAIGLGFGGAVARNRVRRQLRSIMMSLDREGALARGWYLLSLDSDPPVATTRLEQDVRTSLGLQASP